jgi:uncharacterized protein (TIGR02569 family)
VCPPVSQCRYRGVMSVPHDLVLRAFGVAQVGEADLVRMTGGRASTWRAGSTVFKMADAPDNELAWQAEALGGIGVDGFRIALPVPAIDGRFVVDGWCAMPYLPGAHEPKRWSDIIKVGERFHDSIRSIPRPSLLDERMDRWSIGDRVAWGEHDPAMLLTESRNLQRLLEHLRPIAAINQVIHGDLTGNVLFHPHLPPAILDIVPYWRPTGFAAAIVVADALVWEGADEALVEEIAHLDDYAQLLLRALIYRLVTDQIAGSDDDRYQQAIEIACSGTL